MVRLDYLAHSCFQLTCGPVKLLIDPPSPRVGYKIRPRNADFVLVSHDDFDHNHVATVQGRCLPVKGCAGRKLGPFSVHGVLGDHGGDHDGPVTLFVMEAEGVRVVHLSDQGHPLSPEQLAALGAVDVLLVPVGGKWSLDAAGAVAVTAQIKPRVVIPMHFATPFLNRDACGALDGVEPFLSLAGKTWSVERARDSGMAVNDLSAGTRVVLLPHSEN